MQALDVVIKEKFGSLTVEEAKAFVVTDLESKKVAAQRRDLAMDFKKIIVEFFKPHKQGAHKVWRDLCDSEAKYLLAPESLELTYKGKIQLYDRELIRIRQQAEQVERDRLKKLEEDRRLAEAEALETEGRHEEAQAVIEEPVYVPPVSIPIPEEEKVQSYRDNWSAVVIDRDAFFEAAYHNKSLRALWEPNQTALNQQARSLKTLMNIGGVVAKNDPIPIRK